MTKINYKNTLFNISINMKELQKYKILIKSRRALIPQQIQLPETFFCNKANPRFCKTKIQKYQFPSTILVLPFGESFQTAQFYQYFIQSQRIKVTFKSNFQENLPQHQYYFQVYTMIQLNLNFDMDSKTGTPKKKVTRFSEHPQIFQYSSRKKGDSQADNDSFLLDQDDVFRPSPAKLSRVQQSQNATSSKNFQSENPLELEQVCSDLAQIRAYLEDDEPMFSQERSPYLQRPQDVNLQNQNHQRKLISFGGENDLKFGRETMNNQQQINIQTKIKEIPTNPIKEVDENSSQKKKEQKIMEISQLNSEKIKNEIENKKRVTMDVKSLLRMVNNFEDNEKKEEEKRKQKNRITLDVFALTKMIKQQQSQTKQKQKQQTPMKERDPIQAFSTHKKKSAKQISLQILRYEDEVMKRAEEKKDENRKLKQSIMNEDTKIQLFEKRIQNSEKQCSIYRNEIQKMKDYAQKLQRQIEEPFNKEEEQLLDFQNYYRMKIVKYHDEGDTAITYALLKNINLKLKKYKNEPTQIKLLYNEDSQSYQKFFNQDTILKILKNYHQRHLQDIGNLLITCIKLNSFYLNLLDLCEDVQELGQIFDFSDYELQRPSLQKLTFKLNIENSPTLKIQINLLELLDDYRNYNNNTIQVYNMYEKEYLPLNISELNKKIQTKQDSLLFKVMDEIIQMIIR